MRISTGYLKDWILINIYMFSCPRLIALLNYFLKAFFNYKNHSPSPIFSILV